MMDSLVLLVRIAGETVALPSAAVESVVEIEAISVVPLAPPHIAGLAALRSRVVTLVDPRAVLDPGSRANDVAATMPLPAVVVTIDGHPYGIIVEDVLDVLEADGPARPVTGQPAPGWRRVASSAVIVGGRQYLLVDPAIVVAGPAAASASAAPVTASSPAC